MFLDVRAQNIPLSGPMLQQKARDFAFNHGEEDFAASSRWLQRFKAPYNTVRRTVLEERQHANIHSINKWLKEEWLNVLAKYEPEEVFIANETSLFWQILPRNGPV